MVSQSELSSRQCRRGLYCDSGGRNAPPLPFAMLSSRPAAPGESRAAACGANFQRGRTMATQMPFMQETPQALPEVTLIQMITARWVSQAIAVAARLGIADLLGDGPQSCAELAAKAGAHTGSLYRLLRALSSVGIFAEDVAEDGTEAGQARFRLTPLAEPLCANTPGSLRGVAIMFGEPWSVQPRGGLHAPRLPQPDGDPTQRPGRDRESTPPNSHHRHNPHALLFLQKTKDAP